MPHEYPKQYVTDANGEIDIRFYIRQARQQRAEATADLLSRLINRLKLNRSPRKRFHLRANFTH